MPAPSSPSSSSSPFTYTPSLHILASVASVGLELKSHIFNEFYAFLSLFFELSREDTQPPQQQLLLLSPASAADDSVPAAGPLSSACRLHLLHLCASDLEDEHDEGAADSAASPFFTASHDLLALSRLGILAFLRPLVPLLTAVSSPERLQRLVKSCGLPWSVCFAAWSMSRLLLYAATDAVSQPAAADDEAAGELHATMLDFVIDQLRHNKQMLDDGADQPTAALPAGQDGVRPLSFAEASVASHLHRLQRLHLSELAPQASFDNSVSSSSALFPTTQSLPSDLTQAELDASNSQLLWTILRCCQSAATRQRLAHSPLLTPLLLHIIFTSPSSSAFRPAARSERPARSAAAALPQLLAVRILRHVLPLVAPSTADLNSIRREDGRPQSLLSALLAVVSNACLASIRPAAPTSTTASPASPPSVSQLLANECIFLLRTLLASSQWSEPINAVLERNIRLLRRIQRDDRSKVDLQRSEREAEEAEEEDDGDAEASQDRDNDEFAASIHTGSSSRCCPSLSELGRAVASLWVIGGGSPVLGEGARVSVVIDGQFRTGSIISTLPSARQEAAGGASDAEDDLLLEVLVDEAEHPDDIVQDENSQQQQQPAQSSDRQQQQQDKKGRPGHHRSNTLSSAAAAFASELVSANSGFSFPSSPQPNASVYNKTVYSFYASSLTALDAVSVPLLSLYPAAAAGIVSAIASFLRSMLPGDAGRQQTAAAGSQVVARIERRFESVEKEREARGKQQQAEHSAVEVKREEASDETMQEASTEAAAVQAAALSLFWSDLQQRALRCLNILLLRDDIASLVLQQGLGPLLVPLALTQLSHLTPAPVHSPASPSSPLSASRQQPRKGSAPFSSPAGRSVSAGEAAIGLDTAAGGGAELQEAMLSLTDLEARSTALSSLLLQRATETPQQREDRRVLWAAEDASAAAAKAAAEEQQRQREEKERVERASKTPVLFVRDPRHQHSLLFHPRSPSSTDSLSCDICKRRESGPLYYCGDCPFTLCMRCVEPTLAPLRAAAAASAAVRASSSSSSLSSSSSAMLQVFPPSLQYPSHYHRLQFSPVVYDGQFSCDICRQDRGGAAYHCDADKWDVCIWCARDAIREAKEAAEADEHKQAEAERQHRAATGQTGSSLSADSSSALSGASSGGVSISAFEVSSGSAADKRAAVAAELRLLGFPLSDCLRVAAAASSPSMAVSLLLDDVDSASPQELHTEAERRQAGSEGSPWQLVPVAYWPPSLKLAEGIDKIRHLMESYTERSSDLESGSGVGIGSEMDLMSQHRTSPWQEEKAQQQQDGQTAAAAGRKRKDDKRTGKEPAAASASSSSADPHSAFPLPPHYQYQYAVDHDPAQHRHEFGQWKAVFQSQVVHHLELAALYRAAQRNQSALAVLYARRCLLSLLHLLKDQLRADIGGVPGMSVSSSPYASRLASPLPSPKSSPQHRSMASQASPIPALRSLKPASPSPSSPAAVLSASPSPQLKPASLAAPPSPLQPPIPRRSVSSIHSLSSFGPAGFLAAFVALLCSAPHQLTIPQQASQLDGLSGGGGKAGLASLGEIVHTILLAEKQRLESSFPSASPSSRSQSVSQAEFGRLCPIARHLLQDAVVHMLALCRQDAAMDRHSLLNTVIYILEAFFALEDARLQIRHRRLMSIYGGDAAADSAGSGSGSRSNLMLSLLFNVPVCLLMMECIAQTRFPPSAAADSALPAQQEYYAAMDRQRLVFVRLLARVVTLRTRYMDEQQAQELLGPSFFPSAAPPPPQPSLMPAAWLSSHLGWYRILHSRLSSVPISLMSVLESEVFSGRGVSLPHTFFCQAMVDLALLYEKYRKRLFALVPPLQLSWQQLEADKNRQCEEDRKEARRAQARKGASGSDSSAAAGSEAADAALGSSSSDSELRGVSGRRPSITNVVAEARHRSSFSAASGRRRSSLQSPPPPSASLSPLPYTSALLSSPSTPTALSSITTPNADGSSSSISLSDMSQLLPGSPLGLALSELPSTPEFAFPSLSSPLHDSAADFATPSHPDAPWLQDGDRGGSAVPSSPAAARGPVSSPRGSVSGVADEAEERQRDDPTGEDEDSLSAMRDSAPDRRGLQSADSMSAEERQRQLERRHRKRERDSSIWFADISLLEQTLAALRSRTRERKTASPSRPQLQADSADSDDRVGIAEGDEELGDDSPPPRLTRTRSIEERAPMPIIAPDVTPTAAAAEQRDVEKGDTEAAELGNSIGVSPPVTAPASPPQASASKAPVSESLPSPSSPTSSPPALAVGSLLPWEFVETFYSRVQQDVFALAKQKREEQMAKRVREEEEKGEAAHADAEQEAALSAPDWTCSDCTFINRAASGQCEMCDAPMGRGEAALPSSSLPSLSGPVSPSAADPVVYFELTVLCRGSRGAIGIGLSVAGYPQHKMPGWESGSYGWHGDDGKVFCPRVAGRPFSELWKVGDVVGCGLNLRKRELFFVLNGRNLGVAFADVPIADYYCSVGFHSREEAASVNTGQQPFVFQGLPASFVPRPDLTLRPPAASGRVELSNGLAAWKMADSRFPESEPPRNVATSLTTDCSLLQATGALIQGGKIVRPHSHAVGYYEVTLLRCPPQPRLGLGFASASYSLTALPGWEEHSYGLHCDDGFFYHPRIADSRRAFAPNLRAEEGCTIGCGFDRKKREIFFTHNGGLLGIAQDRVDDSSLHATVGLQSSYAVSLNFGQRPFLYTGLPASSLLSDPANVLERHHSFIEIAADGLTASKTAGGESDAGVAQSRLPIIPKSALQLQLEEEEAKHALQLKPASYWESVERRFGVEEDESLVSLVNARCERDDAAMGIIDQPAAFTLTAEERVSFSCLSAASISAFDLQLRLACMSKLNQFLSFAVHHANLSRPARRSVLARHFRDAHVRSLFLFPIKQYLFRQALMHTAFLPDPSQQRPLFQLKLDLFRAQRLQQKKRLDVSGDRSLFGQAFQQLYLHRHSEDNKYGDHDTDPTRLFVPPDGQSRPWKVVFRGMYADDYGGLYRDSLDRICRELQSSCLSLFIPTPNAREQVGGNRHHFVPNPSSRSPTELNMFRFVGRLMGLAMRTGELLFLDLPSVVWKPLVDEAVTEEDVEAIDRLSFTMVNEMRKLESHIHSGKGGLTAESLTDYLDCSFVVVGSDSAIHELVPGGAALPVSWSNRHAFIDALISYRKQEFRLQVAAIKDGLSSVVPSSQLCMFTWQQLQLQVCGQQSVDVDLLQQMTSYEACQPTDQHVLSFWQVMRERFTDSQRNSFLQFVNGSSRLPARAADFDKRFRLQKFFPSSGSADDYLPVAHTWSERTLHCTRWCAPLLSGSDSYWCCTVLLSASSRWSCLRTRVRRCCTSECCTL